MNTIEIFSLSGTSRRFMESLLRDNKDWRDEITQNLHTSTSEQINYFIDNLGVEFTEYFLMLEVKLKSKLNNKFLQDYYRIRDNAVNSLHNSSKFYIISILDFYKENRDGETKLFANKIEDLPTEYFGDLLGENLSLYFKQLEKELKISNNISEYYSIKDKILKYIRHPFLELNPLEYRGDFYS